MTVATRFQGRWGIANPLLQPTAKGINLFHDLYCPLNRSGNKFIRPWTSLRSPEQVICFPSRAARATGGRLPEFYCSLCKTKFKTKFPESNVAKEKAALQKEWDEHLHSAQTRQWEREEKKRARRRAKMADNSEG